MLLYNICLQGYNTPVSFISALWFQSFLKKNSCKHYFSNPKKGQCVDSGLKIQKVLQV